jgi:hypothetical protein
LIAKSYSHDVENTSEKNGAPLFLMTNPPNQTKLVASVGGSAW